MSASIAGDTTDGLPRTVEQIGVIPGPEGVRQPIRLTRASLDGETRWRFSRATVGRISTWYDALGNRWMLENLPPQLLRPGPLELLWWQWLTLPLLIAAAAAIGWVVGRVILFLFDRLVRRTRSDWDDAVVRRLGPPLTAALTCIAVAVLLPLLGLYEPAADAMYRALRAAFLVVFFWAVWRAVDVVSDVALRSHWAHGSAASRSLIPLGERITKVAIVAMAAVAALSLLGYPVASLLAGLGLGGLALALAAQKTVENLFGAFSLGVDQPFRVGDFVKIEDFVGTVELIGLRSTRFRTLDRTLITIPNGRLAEMRIESFSVRDRMRFAATIGLVYGTTPQQMNDVLAGFERVLRAHAKIWPDAVVVRFSTFAQSSLDIEVMAWFETPDWGEFQLIRQGILLQFMEVVERAGTALALPTQRVHLATPSGSRAGAAARASDGSV
ncbi:MAG: mechanosensitive ion channel family protein [Gemmatimonadaceae bacterium]